MTRRLIITLVASLAAMPAFAAEPADTGIDRVALRQAIANVRFDGEPIVTARAEDPPAAQSGNGMSTPMRALWTIAAGFGGFYAGGVIGARIEGGCNGCDDPGLKGALIGAPIGAATAAITTWILSGK